MSSPWNTIFSPGVFSLSFMTNAWIAGTMVAIVAGSVGFFVVLRGSAFAAHALPKGSFAGAAAAAFLGVNTVIGLTVFAVGGALGLGWLSKRGSRDVVTGLLLVFLLGVGALFISLNDMYAPEIYSLLFGEILGVTGAEVLDTFLLGMMCVAVVVVLFRRLFLTSILNEVAAARGIRVGQVEIYFLLLVALATAVTVPIVGALLTFSLMVIPPAVACSLTHRPLLAMGLSVTISVITVWLSLLVSYDSGWPLGFFITTIASCAYILARGWKYWSRMTG